MNFSNLVNHQDVEIKKDQHSQKELEAAAQLLLFNFNFQGDNRSDELFDNYSGSHPEDSDEVYNYKSEDDLASDSSFDLSLKRKRDLSPQAEHQPSDSDGSAPKKLRRKRPCVFTDITHLLTLPQKEAARILGISESMLCKRFKEQTQRKWPYRYLRKVERQMALKRKSKRLTAEDIERLEHLESERNKCLSAVQIRLRPQTFAAYAESGKIDYSGDSIDSDDN